MAKVGRKEERPFNPISDKVIAAVANPHPEKGKKPGSSRKGRGADPVPSLPSIEPERNQSSAQRLLRTKRFKLSEGEEFDIDRAVSRLAAALRTKVNFSHVSRCLWQIFMAHEDEIIDRVKRHVHVSRPHNGDAQALAAFEEELVGAITMAIVNAPRR